MTDWADVMHRIRNTVLSEDELEELRWRFAALANVAEPEGEDPDCE